MKRAEVQKIIEAAVARLAPQETVSIDISHPEPQFGDAATNVAFKLAKALKKAPQAIAEELAAAINDPRVDTAVAVKGFVNLTFTQDYWTDQLRTISAHYASSKIGKGEKVQVEFISANPTGPTTFGNARGGYVGDVVSRVLQATGHDVTREYYFNDGGTQIGKLVESVRAAAGQIEVHDGLQYGGEYIKELAAEHGAAIKDASDSEAATIITQAIFKKFIEPAVEKMGIRFDVWFNERNLIESGQLPATIERLRKADLVYDKDGATWLASSRYDSGRDDRVLIKSNGDPTYLANDLAYHINILEKRDFDRSIKIWGADHVAQFPSLKLTIEQILDGKTIDLIMVQFVRLIRDGVEVKVSKRAGNIITVEEVVEEIGSDVARFFFLMRAAETHIDFDLNLAGDHSSKNPLYYVMYSYARANSIMKLADERRISPIDTINDLTGIEKRLVSHMSRLPQLVEDIAMSPSEVHKLAFYAIEAAQAFHDFYEADKIINMPNEAAAKKLFIVQQYIVFMNVLFGLMGISPQIKMQHDTKL